MARSFTTDDKKEIGGAVEFKKAIGADDRETKSDPNEPKETTKIDVSPEKDESLLNVGTLRQHREATELDHSSGSVTLRHLSSAVRTILASFGINDSDQLEVSETMKLLKSLIVVANITVGGDADITGSLDIGDYLSVVGALTSQGSAEFQDSATFQEIPVIPTTAPTLDGHAISKKYLDDSLVSDATVKTGDYTITESDRFILMNNTTAATVTLDSSAVSAGYIVSVKRIGSASVALTNTTGLIEGMPAGSNLILLPWDSASMLFDGTDWSIV